MTQNQIAFMEAETARKRAEFETGPWGMLSKLVPILGWIPDRINHLESNLVSQWNTGTLAGVNKQNTAVMAEANRANAITSGASSLGSAALRGIITLL